MKTLVEEVLEGVENLLKDTRCLKKVLKGANKIHVRVEKDYTKLLNSFSLDKSKYFYKIGTDYSSYLRSFLMSNQIVIESTQSSYILMKRLATELKSKVEILKIEKKNLKMVKNENNEAYFSSVNVRCEDLQKYSLGLATKSIHDSINSHLISLKGLIIRKDNETFIEKSEIFQKSRNKSITERSLSGNFESILSEIQERDKKPFQKNDLNLTNRDASKIIQMNISSKFFKPKK